MFFLNWIIFTMLFVKLFYVVHCWTTQLSLIMSKLWFIALFDCFYCKCYVVVRQFICLIKIVGIAFGYVFMNLALNSMNFVTNFVICKAQLDSYFLTWIWFTLYGTSFWKITYWTLMIIDPSYLGKFISLLAILLCRLLPLILMILMIQNKYQ